MANVITDKVFKVIISSHDDFAGGSRNEQIFENVSGAEILAMEAFGSPAETISYCYMDNYKKRGVYFSIREMKEIFIQYMNKNIK